MDTHSSFSARMPKLIGMEDYERFAVMVLLVKKKDDYHVVFEVRAKELSTQPGEICFPGGRIEASESPEEAAEREVMEELLVGRNQISFLGPGDIMISPANVLIYPYMALLEDYNNTYNFDEVEEIFTVPLSFFMKHKPERHYVRVKTIPGPDFPYELIPKGSSYSWREGRYQVNFYQYEGKIIWGMTAKIMESAVNLLRFEKQAFISSNKA